MVKFSFLFQIFALSVICSNAFADWTTVSRNHHGTFFVDLNTIKEEGEYVYYWDLGNLNSPIGRNNLSVKSYNQGNCKSFVRRSLKNVFHKKPMGEGDSEVNIVENKKWITPPENSSTEKILKTVCNYKR